MSKEIIKRMRVFAGPNGSGKSTILKEIQKLVETRPYINADDIEKSARESKFVNLGEYNLESNTADFIGYLNQSTLVSKARQDSFTIDLSLSNNVITVGNTTNSYEAALIAEYLRKLLIEKGETFSFETVMSHPSKLEIFRTAHQAGFRNYLYFIATESADINVRRVNARVSKGGHPVSEQKVKARYTRSLELVSEMITYCHRCFLIDNSLEDYRLIAEIIKGQTVNLFSDEIPDWVETYVFSKLGV